MDWWLWQTLSSVSKPWRFAFSAQPRAHEGGRAGSLPAPQPAPNQLRCCPCCDTGFVAVLSLPQRCPALLGMLPLEMGSGWYGTSGSSCRLCTARGAQPVAGVQSRDSLVLLLSPWIGLSRCISRKLHLWRRCACGLSSLADQGGLGCSETRRSLRGGAGRTTSSCRIFMLGFQQADELQAKIPRKGRKSPFHTQRRRAGPQGCCAGAIPSLGACQDGMWHCRGWHGMPGGLQHAQGGDGLCKSTQPAATAVKRAPGPWATS